MRKNFKERHMYKKYKYNGNEIEVFDNLDEVIETIEKYPITIVSKEKQPQSRNIWEILIKNNELGNKALITVEDNFAGRGHCLIYFQSPIKDKYWRELGEKADIFEKHLKMFIDGKNVWDDLDSVERAAKDYYDKITRAHSRESLVKDFSKKFIEDESGACTSASCGCGTGAQTSGGLQAFAPENAVVAGGRNLFVGGVRREKALNIRNTPTGNVKTGGNVEYKRKKQYRNKAFGESLVQQFVRTHLSEDAEGAGDRIILTYTAYTRWHNDVLPDGDFLSAFDDGLLWRNSRNATNWANACDAIGSAPGDDELADYIDEKYHPNAAKAVKKISMEFDKQNEQLLVAVKLNTKATDAIIKDVVDYVNGQMSDGWGEGFEQTPIFEAQIYAVYNDYDIELYINERDAERALTKLQYEQENEYDDEDDDDHSSDYVMDEVNVKLFYSFYKHGVKLPAKVEVQ